MTIVFISIYNNQHQAPLADALYAMPGIEYTYIETEPMPQSVKDIGWTDYSKRPYVLRTYESDENVEKAKKIIFSAHVAVMGFSSEKWITQRLQAGKLTFRCSERWFKNRPWWTSGFRSWYSYFRNHIRYRNAPLYMLAQSAYLANDLSHLHAYPNKIYKFAYFTEIRNYEEKTRLLVQVADRIDILWCARFLKLKHPELPILLAVKLKSEHYNFRIDMIGTGEELNKIKQLAKDYNVEDCVYFLGNKPNAEVHQLMQNHPIFLFTSDQNEGWGAVLNEAMSNGCAVVASDMIGAAPFLIKNEKNGLLFKSKDIDSLYKQTKRLLDDVDLRKKLGREAYHTMRNDWSPENGAIRFVELCHGLLQGKEVVFEDGPCSKAFPL